MCKKIYNSVIDGDDGVAGPLGPARVKIDCKSIRHLPTSVVDWYLSYRDSMD